MPTVSVPVSPGRNGYRGQGSPAPTSDSPNETRQLVVLRFPPEPNGVQVVAGTDDTLPKRVVRSAHRSGSEDFSGGAVD